MTNVTGFLGATAVGVHPRSVAERVIGLAAHAGLAPLRLRVRHRSKGGAEGDRFASGLAGVLAAAGIDGQVQSPAPAPEPATPERIARAAADADVVAIEVEGAGWALTLPLAAGLASGVAPFDGIDAKGLRFLMGLFNSCLADWAIAGPYREVESRARTVKRGRALPTGQFTWRGPDLLTDVEVLGAPMPAGVALHRSATGAAVLIAGGADLPALRANWTLPPVRWFDFGGSEPAALRALSQRLKRRQETLAARVAQRTGLQIAVASIDRLEATTTPASLAPQLCEELSAFVGEAALALGGAWHRVLDATIPFPASLLVLLGDRAPFYPQASIARWSQGGHPPSVTLERALAALR
jgi:hypothetical protein